MEIKIHTKAQGPTLHEYLLSKSRVSFIMGPLGSGKTFASCEKILRIMMEQEPDRQGVRRTRGYCIRNTYSDLLTTTIKDWLDLFGDLGKYSGSLAPPPTHKVSFGLPDGTTVQSELVFLALDKPNSIKRLRGSQVTFFWLNEVKELPKAVVDMADSRYGRYPSAVNGARPTWHGMIGDYNAPDDDHWLYRLSEEDRPEGWMFYKQPGGVVREYEAGKRTGQWLVNPKAENVENLPLNYYKDLTQGKGEDWVAVNLGNEYGLVRTGQPIYAKQWDDSIHVNDKIQPTSDTLIIGLDFGLTPAAVFVQETSTGLQMCHEAVGQDIGISQFTKHVVKPLIREHYKGCEVIVIGDPAGAQRSQTDLRSPFDVLAELGMSTEPASSNTLQVRWDNVRNLLTTWYDQKPLFQLHPRCKYTRKGFISGYSLRRLQVIGDEKYASVPDKNIYSHVHEALQYAADYIQVYMLGRQQQDFSRPNKVSY